MEATNGSEAVEKSKRLLPSLVILDLSLPGMNGLQLAQELREVMPRLPIFLLTTDRNFYVEKEALSFGIAAVFSRQEDLETIVANARVVCGMTGRTEMS